MGLTDKTHDFIHTTLYCTFPFPLSQNVIKQRGVTVVVFKISERGIVNNFGLSECNRVNSYEKCVHLHE